MITNLLIKHFGQNIDIKLAGSISNNLNMPWSDLNMHLTPKKNSLKYKYKDKYYKDVYNFKNMLMREHFVKDCTL